MIEYKKILYIKPSQERKEEVLDLVYQIAHSFRSEFDILFDFSDFDSPVHNVNIQTILSEDVTIRLITDKCLDTYSINIEVWDHEYIELAQSIYDKIEGWSVEEIMMNIHNTPHQTAKRCIWHFLLMDSSLNGSTVPLDFIASSIIEELSSDNPINRENALYAIETNPLYATPLLPFIENIALNDEDNEVRQCAKEVLLDFMEYYE
ncbi:MAG: hypothetical protein MUC49_22435 [Raineya sp.]|jgi:hypothetical protein|nr:hypothetical protein [Raineya sp.]